MDCSGVGDSWSLQRFLGRTKLADVSERQSAPPKHLMLPLNCPLFQPAPTCLCIFITPFSSQCSFRGRLGDASSSSEGSSNEVGRWWFRYHSSPRPNPPFILTTVCSKCAKLTMARYAGGGAVRETRDDFIQARGEDEGSLEFTLLLPPWLLTPPQAQANNLFD